MPRRSLQRSHVREAQETKYECVQLCFPGHKHHEGAACSCTLDWFCHARVCVCIDQAERSRGDLLR